MAGTDDAVRDVEDDAAVMVAVVTAAVVLLVISVDAGDDLATLKVSVA